MNSSLEVRTSGKILNEIAEGDSMFVPGAIMEGNLCWAFLMTLHLYLLRGWGDSSVYKVLAMKTCGPAFDPHPPLIVLCTWAVETEDM